MEYYDEDEEYYEEDLTNNWLVKINGSEHTSCETKEEAITEIIDYILDITEFDISKIRLSNIEEKLENNDELIEYLTEVDSNGFYLILNELLNKLKIKEHINLVNLNGEEREFEEL